MGGGKDRTWPDPAELLRHLGIEEPGEIDLEAIAAYCGATIIRQRLRGCGASLVSHGGDAIIAVDSAAHPYRQRFSAAHELGHWMLHRGELAHVYTGDPAPAEWVQDGWFVEGPERQANRWAADLLMPEAFFTYDALDREITFDTVRWLARRYRTSLTATALRLVDCTSYPALVVCSRPGQRWRFFHAGPDVSRVFWPRPEPGPGTLAHGLLGSGTRRRAGPADVWSDAWFERQDGWWYTIREDSVASGNGEVLTLLWWQDQAQIIAQEWPHGTWLPWSPGRKARSRLVKTLREKWGYRRVRGAKGEPVLVTDEPSEQRIVIPDHRSLDKETARGVVAAVAEHKGAERGDVLLSMLVEPKWVAKEEERAKHRRPVEDLTPPWLEPWRDE